MADKLPISPHATPEQILDRVREWIVGDVITGTGQFGEGYRAALSDIRSQIAAWVAKDHGPADQVTTSDPRLTTQEDDIIWDAVIPAGGTSPSNLEIHRRVCKVVADMLEQQRAALTGQVEEIVEPVKICERPHETTAEEDECEVDRVAQIASSFADAQLIELVNDIAGVAQNWATSDDMPTRAAGRTVQQYVDSAVKRAMGPAVDDPSSVISPTWLKQQYLHILGKDEYGLVEDEQAKLAADLVAFYHRYCSMLVNRLRLADQFRQDNVREDFDREEEINQLNRKLRDATSAEIFATNQLEEFRTRTANFLVNHFIEGEMGDE